MARRMFPLLAAIAAIVAAAAPPPAAAQAPKPLEVEVLHSGAGSLNANFALIKGERDAVLVDAPFTMADAHRVVAMEVVKAAFPDVQIVAHPTVVADIWKSLPFKVKRWSPMLGANGPVHPTAPAAMTGDTIMLEGRELKVIGPMPGDHHNATALWVPSIKALFPGDLVFDQMYLWLGEHDKADIAAWGASLNRLAALQPAMVVAGHEKPGADSADGGLGFSRRYIQRWLALSATAKNSAELRAGIQKEFPGAIDTLGDFLLGTSSRVTMGEEAKWQE